MSITKEIREIFDKLGYSGQRNPVPFIIFTILFFFVGIFNAISIPNVWNLNKIQRFMAIKDFNILVSVYGIGCHYWLVPDRMSTLLDTADQQYQPYRNIVSDNFKTTLRESKSEQKSLLEKTLYLLVGIVTVVTVTPLIVTVYLVYIQKVKVNINELPLPFVFWFPKNYDTIEYYFFVLAVEAYIYLISTLAHIYCMYGSIIIALHAVIIDLKLFSVSLREMNQNIHAIGNTLVLKEKPDETNLKEYLRYIVKRHQAICKSVSWVNKSVGYVASLGNQCICFQMCVYLYCACEIDNYVAKIGYLSITCMDSLVMLIYCYKGQQVINEADELRRSLAECEWEDKPIWFKKTLIILMTKANAPLHIKPFGLYVLNLNAYTNVMNAAYTYFNMLRTTKK